VSDSPENASSEISPEAVDAAVQAALDAIGAASDTAALKAARAAHTAEGSPLARLNARLRDAGLPVRIANLSSIWTISYTIPSRYNWMLQYYLRAEGLALSWIGTGRLIFSLNYIDADFDAVVERFVAAAKAMQHDGWWAGPAVTNKTIRRAILKEILAERFLKRA